MARIDVPLPNSQGDDGQDASSSGSSSSSSESDSEDEARLQRRDTLARGPEARAISELAGLVCGNDGYVGRLAAMHACAGCVTNAPSRQSAERGAVVHPCVHAGVCTLACPQNATCSAASCSRLTRCAAQWTECCSALRPFWALPRKYCHVSTAWQKRTQSTVHLLVSCSRVACLAGCRQ